MILHLDSQRGHVIFSVLLITLYIVKKLGLFLCNYNKFGSKSPS